MFLSIIIPIYNSQNTIVKCLDSILNQDFLDYEIILIDDGSNDNTDELIKGYIFNHKETSFIYKTIENSGPSIARNIAMELASGDYVWFVDSDDEIEKEALQIIYDTVTKSDCDILRFSYRTITNDARLRSNLEFAEDLYEDASLIPFIYNSLMKSWYISMNCWQHIYRRKLIMDTKFLPDKKAYGEDVLFNCLVYPKAKKIQVIADILYDYYVRDNSISHTRQKVLEKTVDYYHIIKNDYLKNNIWDIYKYAIYSAYGDYAILGGGKKKNGALYLEYKTYQDIVCAEEYINRIILSDKFEKLIKDALSRELPDQLKDLYELLLNSKSRKVFEFLNQDPLKKNETQKEEDKVVFKTKLEIMDIGDQFAAVSVGTNEDSLVLNLDEDSARVLRYLIETESINRTLELLYKTHAEDDPEEVKEYFLDFVSELKSQHII